MPTLAHAPADGQIYVAKERVDQVGLMNVIISLVCADVTTSPATPLSRLALPWRPIA